MSLYIDAACRSQRSDEIFFLAGAASAIFCAWCTIYVGDGVTGSAGMQV